MKNIFIICCLVLPLASFSQDIKEHENFFRVGVKGGVNINKISGVSYNDGFSYNYIAGAFIQFNLTHKLGIQPEVNVVQSEATFTNTSTEVYDDLFRDGSQRKASFNYLEVPVLLNLNVGPSKRVKLQAGPSVGFLIDKKLDSLRHNSSELVKKAQWSAIGGLWLQLPLVNLGARYSLGLTDLNAFNDSRTWRSQGIQFFVGLTF